MSLAKDFMDLFQCLSTYYSQRVIGKKKNKKGKLEAEYLANQEPITEKVWEEHLSGKSLGIVPILDSGCTSSFGVIDVDIYQDLPHADLCNQISSLSLPLVVTRSKSGGAHLYCFSTNPIPTVLMRRVLETFCILLGLKDVQLFPAQESLLLERGDVGSTISVPYDGGDKSERYGFDSKGNRLTSIGFIEYCKTIRKDLRGIRTSTTPLLKFEDGPPCLEQLIKDKILTHRNDFLFNVGVYLKLSEKSMKDGLNQINDSGFEERLPDNEVKSLIKQLERKDYMYKCNEAPINDYCNKELCKLRQYGIASSTSYLPAFGGGVIKLESDSPTWFLDIENLSKEMVRAEFTTEELLQSSKFKQRCMEVIHLLPRMPKQNKWEQLINEKLEKVQVIKLAKDLSLHGQVLLQLDKFGKLAGKSLNANELALGRPFYKDGYIYFRANDFYIYLFRNKFTSVSLAKLGVIFQKEINSGFMRQEVVKAGEGREYDVYVYKDGLEKIELAMPDKIGNDLLI